MDRADAIFHYWGKARPTQEPEGGRPSCHLLPYHSLDVAAVGVAYLRRFPALSRMFTGALECSEDQWLGWAAFWLALHDLGKFSEAFQSQKPELFERWHGRPPSVAKPYNERHDSLGHWIWRGMVFECARDEGWFGPKTKMVSAGLDAWMRAVTGHHGQPPKSQADYFRYFSRADENAVLQFVQQVRQLLLLPSAAEIPSDIKGFQHLSQRLSWWFAGIAVLADWVGSNTEYFPYCDEPMPLERYWAERAAPQAERALKATGALPVDIAYGKGFEDFFPDIEAPSPLQQWAQAIAINAGPQLHFMEDVTGAGKTEAAMMLAYRLMEAELADGFFIGLPTMATANAMYDRIAQVYRQLFSGDPSLMLAHGSKELVESFAKSVLPAAEEENDRAQEDQTASIRCAAWLADHNKRALLAPAGVGTIDQALLAVLHSRHQSLRLLGLFRKVLVIDEVHACDAYMQRVLEVLLEFHAQAGGSAILLSATLPEHMKQALFAAFMRGVGHQGVPDLSYDAYPLVTSWHVGAEHVGASPLGSRSAVCRQVDVKYFSVRDEVIKHIHAALVAGKCVCWIRNTVTDAVEAYGYFSGALQGDPILFHARFSLADRLEKEGEIKALFGPESLPEQRSGRLVIATQVIEQSLDVDFDVVVSDLAPIDRLLQRAGRMHRHVRDARGERDKRQGAVDGRGKPALVVYGPPYTESPDERWFKAEFPKAAQVYPHHGQLWRTARELQAGGFEMPADARRLIEAVFSKRREDVPAGLQAVSQQIEGQVLADAGIAQCNTLKFAQGYVRGDVMDWWTDARTPSRLGEASQNVVLARWVEGRLLPWSEREHAWAYSTVRLPERLIQEAVVPISEKQAVLYHQTKAMLPAQGRWSILLVLEPVDATTWAGVALPPRQRGEEVARPQRWLYDEWVGLRLAESD